MPGSNKVLYALAYLLNVDQVHREEWQEMKLKYGIKARLTSQRGYIPHGGFGLSPKCIEESMKDWKQMNYIIQFVFLKDHPCLCLKF